MKAGDWVTVKPAHDIPPMFRDNKPTRGRIDEIDGDTAIIWVSIGGAPVDEHSQSVPYPLEVLELEG